LVYFAIWPGTQTYSQDEKHKPARILLSNSGLFIPDDYFLISTKKSAAGHRPERKKSISLESTVRLT
jgi:hypothetical protein